MKVTEKLLSTATRTDKKCKLNRLHRRVNQSHLDAIEAGVTIEDLEAMQKAGLPIFKYQTQITIHGFFPELQVQRIGGYKNLFQNKNKSIGVKHTAIDEAKRERIAKRLQVLGLRYNRNSSSCGYIKQWRITKETFEAIRSEAMELSGRFDETLFMGSKSVWIGEAFGLKYMVFDLTINAIYESNIEPFLNKAGATIEALKTMEDKETKERVEREAYWKEKRAKELAERAKAMEGESEAINELKARYSFVEKTQEPGKYIKPGFDYKQDIEYKVTYIYELPGKKKPRFNRVGFATLSEALNHEAKQGYSDEILNGSVTGYKVQ